MLADEALNKLLSEYAFQTVLDIGCGSGEHTEVFRAAGKSVTAIDKRPACQGAILGDYQQHVFERPFDCIWSSHVLEHQPNVHLFLSKMFSDLADGGILAVTVPPAKPQIVGGHLTLWNAGLLLYNLIVAGFDCSKAAVKKYGYNVSVITPKIPADYDPAELMFAGGDIERLRCFFPAGASIDWKQGFDGDIVEINWRRARRLPWLKKAS